MKIFCNILFMPLAPWWASALNRLWFVSHQASLRNPRHAHLQDETWDRAITTMDVSSRWSNLPELVIKEGTVRLERQKERMWPERDLAAIVTDPERQWEKDINYINTLDIAQKWHKHLSEENVVEGIRILQIRPGERKPAENIFLEALWQTRMWGNTNPADVQKGFEIGKKWFNGQDSGEREFLARLDSNMSLS